MQFPYIRHLNCHFDAYRLFAAVCLLELLSLSALSSSLKGQAAAAASSDEGPALPTVKDVCAAYCSLAEIYLSDLWYGWKNAVSMHEHCLDNQLTTVLLPCVRDLAAWRKERRTNVESVLREHYSTTVTAQRLCSSWPVTCSVQRETRSASTHTCTRTHTQELARTHTRRMSYHHIKAGICWVNYSEQIELYAINQQMDTCINTHAHTDRSRWKEC